MNLQVEKLLDDLRNKRHHAARQIISLDLSEDFSRKALAAPRRVSSRFINVLALEKPVILGGQRIVFMRTVDKLPALFTREEWEGIRGSHFIHEQGTVCNISPDYASTIHSGLVERKNRILERITLCIQQNDMDGEIFLKALLLEIDAVIDLSDRYKEEAKKVGNKEVFEMLLHIPRFGARTFYEALQFFRILHFALWCEGEYHNTIGRFDQYMAPYLMADIEAGRLNEEEALDLLEEFFISFNWDSDLYPGVQQGDNGQSLVLGGVDGNGRDAFNLLSSMCLEASRELKLIDPKINLRVHKDTSLEVYKTGTLLTKEGLGFPQYSNDEIVIPGLCKKGYRKEDARNYVVAACWEFIIPNFGMDIPNIGALSFPKIVDVCLHEKLEGCKEFNSFLNCIVDEIHKECDRIAEGLKNLWMIPAPFMSLLMDGCIEKASDISGGARYNNYGIHGTGLATAVDSLAAIRKYVYEEKTISCCELIKAIDEDFAGDLALAARLRYDSPKMGNDDDTVDIIAVKLLEAFAETLNGYINERGGCFRAGTGSAMFYLRHAAEIGASPDGRRKGEAFGANFSPSLFARVNGPISVIKSFSKPNLIRTINGGPLTLELHNTLFRDVESIEKVAQLVKAFMHLGGHQIQLNAVNKETLIDAQSHPEKYRNLIVRVWGWSAYFVELDREYQDHIINRQEYDF